MLTQGPAVTSEAGLSRPLGLFFSHSGPYLKKYFTSMPSGGFHYSVSLSPRGASNLKSVTSPFSPRSLFSSPLPPSASEMFWTPPPATSHSASRVLHFYTSPRRPTQTNAQVGPLTRPLTCHLAPTSSSPSPWCMDTALWPLTLPLTLTHLLLKPHLHQGVSYGLPYALYSLIVV